MCNGRSILIKYDGDNLPGSSEWQLLNNYGLYNDGVSFWENLAYVCDIINSGFVCPVNHPDSGTVIAEAITHLYIKTNTRIKSVIFGFVMFGKVLGR